MKKRRIISIIFIILIIAVSFLLYQKAAKKNLSAEQVVRHYYKYKNTKNLDKINELFIASQRVYDNKHWVLDDIEYIKLLEIKGESDYSEEDYIHNVTRGFLQNGRGKVLKPYAVKSFFVEYEVKYKNNNPRPLDSGKHFTYFTVVKEKEDSPWLIAEIGF